jgi:hypothetical protein
MILNKVSSLVLAGALSLGAASCADYNRENSNTATTPSAQEVEKEDGSVVTETKAPDGTVTEIRTFETGEVSRVTRTTPPTGRRTAAVEFRDGRKVDLEDDNDIEEAMDATGDAIADAATRAWDAAKEIGEEVGDKTEDVAGKTVDVTKDVGSKVGKGAKRGAEKVKDAAGDTAEAVGKGVKKVGKKIKGDGQ